MIIRKASKNDIPSIVGLMKNLISFHAGIDHYYKPVSAYRGLAVYAQSGLKGSKKAIFVAEVHGNIIGYLFAEVRPAPFFSKERFVGAINDVCTAPMMRQRGVLKELWKHAAIWFKSRRVSYIELSVHIKNDPAIKAWKKLGFYAYRARMRKNL